MNHISRLVSDHTYHIPVVGEQPELKSSRLIKKPEVKFSILLYSSLENLKSCTAVPLSLYHPVVQAKTIQSPTFVENMPLATRNWFHSIMFIETHGII